jgi:adenosylcobinamide-GDP ribazoletransferase
MLNDIRAAFAFLTILPVGSLTARKPGYAFAWFPLVGLVIGAAWVTLANIVYPSPELRGFVLLAVSVIVTGGLHLDGFGDSCDGLLATTTSERRLEIMKDPRAGTWAVVGLLLLALGKWIALQTIKPELLILPPLLGRWLMVIAAYAFPYARAKGGLGSYFREGLGIAQVVVATLTMVLALVFQPLVMVLIAGSVATLVFAGTRWAAARLGGGLTGDVYGALCEFSELLCLIGLVWIGG